MNENMSAGKILAGGIGIVGLIGAAIYIYKRVKEAQKPIEITLDDEADENTEAAEVAESSEEAKEAEKAEKKAAISEKISNVSKKIGKSVGTFCLKFGAKHPKITKGLLQFGKYIPYAVLGIAVLASLPFYNRARNFMEGVDPDSVTTTDDGIEFTRYLPENTDSSDDDDEAYKNTCDAYHKYIDDHTFVNVGTVDDDPDSAFAVQKMSLDKKDQLISSWENGTGRTNYEKVKACADSLELNPYEGFIICDVTGLEDTKYKGAIEKGAKYVMKQQYVA